LSIFSSRMAGQTRVAHYHHLGFRPLTVPWLRAVGTSTS